MKKFLLIDANSLIHRSFHALPPLTGEGGIPTGALYGLSRALLKVLDAERPDYVAAAFDRPEPTFRKKMFGDYKAHRPKAPDELISQIIEAHNLFNKFGINFFEAPGYEADDIIGTFVKKFGGGNDLRLVILTGDLDTLQLVKGDRIVVDILRKGVSETALYDEKAVIQRYGLKPGQMTDYKGLVGDASDNIPGVRGVGPKTAENWLKKYGSLEELFKRMPADDPSAKKILPFKKDALFSKKLATINCAAPVKTTIGDTRFAGIRNEVLVPYLGKLGFESIVRRMGSETMPAGKPLTQGLFAFEPEGKRNDAGDKERVGEIDVAWDWKPIIKKLLLDGKNPPSRLFDLGVAGWVLDSGGDDFSPQTITGKFLKHAEGSNRGGLIRRVFLALDEKIKSSGLGNVFYKIEMPLIPVLAQMEIWGIGMDKKRLDELSGDMNRELSGLTKKIHDAAGEPFNINSSQQLAEILFKKLGIKTEKNKKTGTGRRSTSEEVLLPIRESHPVIGDVLSYRETFKIKSTYVEPLLLARGKDGRVRTNFIQTGTTTGRLASEKPNLQNIPQESKWSEPLRRAFVAEPGFSFASFDYAQLELRLLAHMTLEDELLGAFDENRDIHTLTASRVLRIPPNKVTKQERRLGKTLNFGVIYGMGPRAFSRSAGIGFEEAKGFIDDYFREFPKIKKWQDEVKMRARKNGFVENLNGRRRWFFDDVRNPKARGEIERAAINMPLQSLGADILKMAMIKSFDFIKNRNRLGHRVRLILSIHDELLFEIRDDILEETVPVVKKLMEKVLPLASPLLAEARTGKNLGELEKHKNV